MLVLITATVIVSFFSSVIEMSSFCSLVDVDSLFTSVLGPLQASDKNEKRKNTKTRCIVSPYGLMMVDKSKIKIRIPSANL